MNIHKTLRSKSKSVNLCDKEWLLGRVECQQTWTSRLVGMGRSLGINSQKARTRQRAPTLLLSAARTQDFDHIRPDIEQSASPYTLATATSTSCHSPVNWLFLLLIPSWIVRSIHCKSIHPKVSQLLRLLVPQKCMLRRKQTIAFTSSTPPPPPPIHSILLPCTPRHSFQGATTPSRTRPRHSSKLKNIPIFTDPHTHARSETRGTLLAHNSTLHLN